MGMLVVARPVNKSGWKLSIDVAAGGGALPAETVLVPGRAACTLCWKSKGAQRISHPTKFICVEKRIEARTALALFWRHFGINGDAAFIMKCYGNGGVRKMYAGRTSSEVAPQRSRARTEKS